MALSSRAILATLAAAAWLAVVPVAHADAGGTATDAGIQPVDWSRFTAGAPEGADAERARRILLNANRHVLVTSFPQRYGGQTGRYIDFGDTPGAARNTIRSPASEALALAAALVTDAYDPAVTGVPREEARAIAVRLVSSIAHGHLANRDAGWGDEWQSALWAYYAGYAAWLLWDDLAPEDRENVRRMIEHEADRFVGYEVPYYRDDDGTVVFPGDSKAEENAWNANILQLATAMLPRHAHQRLWMDKNLELMISAFARPADVGSQRRVNGKRLAAWLNGSNISDDGTLVNHGFIHPDYMATVLHNTNAALSYGLGGMAAPEAAFFNADLVYRALVDHEFASPPYSAPGGTIYVDGSTGIYYPQGNDWGTHRRMHFALLDAQANLFGLDGLASTPAATWEPLHGSMVLEMQSRFADGRTYGAGSEDTFEGREQWVAAHAAQAWLTHWLVHQRAFRVTDRAYPVPPRDRAPATLTMQVPELTAGRPAQVVTTLDNRTQPRLTQVQMRLELPEGWSAEATSPATFTSVGAGEEVTTTWDVTASAGGGLTDITAEAGYRAAGRSHTVRQTARVVVDRVPRDELTVTASDAQAPYVASRAIDGDLRSFWHSQYSPYLPLPHSLTLALERPYDLTALYYHPRLDHPNGAITRYRVHASADGSTFTEVAAGKWAPDYETKHATFSAPGARFIRLEALAGAGGYASAAEVVIAGEPAAGQ